jgi:hypothetical protein
MDGWKELLSKAWLNGLVGLFGWLLTAIGLVLFLTTRSRSRVAAQINSLELVGVNSVLPDEIEFLFRGNKVPKVTLSRIAIWNIGNTTLTADQIVDGDPLLIVTSEGSEILEATILNCTRQVNEFSCVRVHDVPNQAFCRFDYLDPQDGALIQIIHTGTDKVQVVGTLRGIRKRILVKSVSKKDETKKPDAGAGSRRVGQGIGIVAFLLGFGFLLLALLKPSLDPKDTKAGFLVGTVFMLMGILAYWLSGFMPPTVLGTQITTIDPKKQFLSGIFRALRKQK